MIHEPVFGNDGVVYYRGYRIVKDPPPIPVRDFDWQFAHVDFDGAPDSGDNRCGEAVSLSAAIAEIEAIIADEEYDEDEFCGCELDYDEYYPMG